MPDQLFIPNIIQSTTYEIKKSQFIGTIAPINLQTEAVKILQQQAEEHPQANHIAFAWKIRNPDGSMNIKFHDAGEPSGTAGKPILNYLEGAGLINCIITVVRYFGGVKLGAGGLTRAYGTAAKQVIEVAELKPWVLQIELQFYFDYSEMQQFEYDLKQHDGVFIHQEFLEQIHVKVQLPESNSKSFIELHKNKLLKESTDET